MVDADIECLVLGCKLFNQVFEEDVVATVGIEMFHYLEMMDVDVIFWKALLSKRIDWSKRFSLQVEHDGKEVTSSRPGGDFEFHVS